MYDQASTARKGNCVYEGAAQTLTAPGVMTGVKTIVFVGVMPSSFPHYVVDFRPASGNYGWLYKFNNGLGSNVLNGTGGQAAFRVDGSYIAAHATKLPGSVYVGQRHSLNEFWPGSWRTVGFDRQLTTGQVEDGIADLKEKI